MGLTEDEPPRTFPLFVEELNAKQASYVLIANKPRLIDATAVGIRLRDAEVIPIMFGIKQRPSKWT